MMKDKFFVIREKLLSAKRFMTDINFRAILSAVWSSAINLGYTVYNGYLGFKSGSVWFITMCFYYAVLFIMRCFILLQSRSGKRERDALIMRVDGILLVVLMMALTGIISLSLNLNIERAHGKIAMLVLVIYTVFKLGVAITSFYRVRLVMSPIIRTICNIGFADALVSLISMILTIFAVLGIIDRGRAFIVFSGAVVCMIIAMLAASMVFYSKRHG